MNSPARRTRLLGLGVVLLGLFAAGPARAAVSIELKPGVKNPADSITSTVPERAIADTIKLVPSATFDPLVTAVMAAQGFTKANGWVYSSAPGDLPAGLTNPIAMPDDAKFVINQYELLLNAASTAFGEKINFDLVNPPAAPKLDGATVTAHWLQYINTDAKVNGFGFALTGQSGFWQLDNGQKSWAAGVGPFYDSNAPPGDFSVPNNLYDFPRYYAGVGTYLHFTTILAWDVAKDGKDYLIVANTGLTWGFGIVPEPGAVILLVIGLVFGPIARRRLAA